jgi:hypothetical protein
MNTVETINTEYLHPSRTIETVLVSDLFYKKIFFVYNYEGYSFRLFETIIDLIDFVKGDATQNKFHFKTEEHLDSFLLNIELKN